MRGLDIDLGPVHALGLDPRFGQLASNGKYYKFNCPYCQENGEPTPDTKFRLHIRIIRDAEYGRYKCFRCGKRGRAGSNEVELNFSLLRQKVREGETLAKRSSNISLPAETYPIMPGMSAWDYLIGRGLIPDDIKYYDVAIAKQRILFPDYFDGKLCYWTARAYDGRNPKYSSCPGLDGAQRDSQIYNLGRFLDTGTDRVILVEGPISAIVAGRDAIATYGKAFSEAQLERIKFLDIRAIYLAFDPDARMTTIQLARKLLDSFEEVHLVPVPIGHDPATMGREWFRAFVDQRSMRFGYDTPDVPIKFRLSA